MIGLGREASTAIWKPGPKLKENLLVFGDSRYGADSNTYICDPPKAPKELETFPRSACSQRCAFALSG